MSQTLRVLQVEDSESDARLIVRLLEKAGYQVRALRVEDAEGMRAALAGETWDVIIADYRMPRFDAPAALGVLRETDLDLPFLVVSGAIGEDVAVAMMKAGAHDYLLKDKLARMAPAVEREIREAQVRREQRQAAERLRVAEEDVRLSEQRYRSLFDNMLNGFAYCRMLYDEGNRPVDFITLEVNPAFERLTGARDVVGRRVTEVFPGIRESNPELFEIQGRVALTGRPENFELGLPGISRWLSVSVYSPERGYCVWIFEDITERKRHEADRESMVALLRLLNSPNDTRELIRTVTGLLQEWSGCEAVGIRLRDGDDFPYFETHGFPAEFVEAENSLCMRDANREAVRDQDGKPVLECLCGEILSGRFDPALPFFTAGGSFWTNSVRKLEVLPAAADALCNTRGRCREQGFESIALIPLRSSGRTLGLLQFSDRQAGRFTAERLAQTERFAASLAIALEQRRTQAALRSSEERYRLISANTVDVIWLVDVNTGCYTFVSPSVQHMLGYSPEELLAKDVTLTLTPQSREAAAGRLAEVRAALEASDDSVRTQIQEVEQVRKDGSIVQTEVATTLMPNGQGGFGEILGVTRDITERVHAEARLLRAQKMESVGRLAGGVAHDFNNLLTVINGYSDMLIDQLPPDDPMHELVSEIRTAGERGAALSGQLLVLSRKQVVQLRKVNLNEIIVEVQKMLGRLIGEDIRLESVLSPSLGWVLSDPGQLHQVLMNLAVNARDAMPGGGTLLIETANVAVDGSIGTLHADVKPGAYVQLKVSDTGVGMTKEVMAHLFEPFFTTKDPGQGTGLGLATVFGIVKQNGGSIWVYSEPDKGTRFEIYLPRIEPVGGVQDVPKPAAADLRGAETILVVEDQEQLRKMAVRLLRSHGYNVLEAAHPEEALRDAERYAGPIHLLLTDMVMPGMSGRDLACLLKPMRPSMKIIFMSGHSERALIDRQMLAAAGAYLAKPFSPDALAIKVREVLGAPRTEGTIVVADDEPGVRIMLRKILTRAGYRVLEAKNGRETVQLVEASAADLLITDLAMPEQEGIETVERLHRDRPQLKIIALTGQFGGSLLDIATLLGAHAKLAKPFQPDELLDAVTRVLKGETNPPEAAGDATSLPQ